MDQDNGVVLEGVGILSPGISRLSKRTVASSRTGGVELH